MFFGRKQPKWVFLLWKFKENCHYEETFKLSLFVEIVFGLNTKANSEATYFCPVKSRTTAHTRKTTVQYWCAPKNSF